MPQKSSQISIFRIGVLVNIVFFFALPSFSSELLIPEEVIEIKTHFSKSKIGNVAIYRAIVFHGGSEGVASIGLEKYTPGEEGNLTKILFQKKQPLTELGGFNDFITNKSKQSQEAVYGCCKVTDLIWASDNKINFNIEFVDRIFKTETIERNGKNEKTSTHLRTEIVVFACKSTSLDNKNPTLSCIKQ